MAHDWIKMRTDLYRDPKVCVIADILLDEKSDLARYVNQHMQRDMSVTRNVMRNVTVGALVSVWGVLRHRGKRDLDDLVIRGCTTSIIDDIADIPGFGSALEQVGWVAQTEDGIVFHNFFEEFNVDPEQEAKQKNAERQRRYREKHKEEQDQKSNVTVTLNSNAREEKSREDIKPIITPDKQAIKKGTQVPKDFTPNETTIQRAATLGVDWKAELPKFIDHHSNKGTIGKDWDAGFRTWLANSIKFGTAVLAQVPAAPVRPSCACCGAPASRKELNSWYCSKHDKFSEREAA